MGELGRTLAFPPGPEKDVWQAAEKGETESR